MRTKIIAGNWKMYKTAREAKEYFAALLPLVKGVKSQVFLSVPFTALEPAVTATQGSSVWIGAQNMHDAEEGAFTGEISAAMLKEAGARFVLLGHSERRKLFFESNAFIRKKVERALRTGLVPILCVGETLEEREKGKTEEVLTTQLKECLDGFSSAELAPLILAYEPVWAIGTGKTATPEIAEQAHLLCRTYLRTKWGQKTGELSILYGGSVKADNIEGLMRMPNIDGALVGGASLSPAEFAKLVNIGKN